MSSVPKNMLDIRTFIIKSWAYKMKFAWDLSYFGKSSNEIIFHYLHIYEVLDIINLLIIPRE